ncbi:hypothetical protein B0H19DRAFT_1067636 [Mycena capillaripes]|nr:hypothetical protein B0H19DRAFT_1067636 [Mycena capillaripes]
MHPWTGAFLLFTLGSATVGNCQGGSGGAAALSLCPSVDQDGVARSGASVVTAEFMECDYSGSQCIYSISLIVYRVCSFEIEVGSFFSGPSTCPPSAISSAAKNLPVAPNVSSTSAVRTSSRVTASALGLTSTGTGSSATSPPLVGSSTASTRLPTQAIGAIVFTVMVVMFLIFSGTIFFLRRRRLRRRATERDATQTRSQTGTISPFTLITQIDGPSEGSTGTTADSDARSLSESTMARHQLEMELLAVQEKMVDLEDEERHSTIGGAHRMSRPPSMPATSGNVDAQLQIAREQIDMLILRINALEANTDPAWGLGISREPPPEYV